MSKMERVDWSFIKPLWIAGGLSNCEICRMYVEAHKDQDQWKATVCEKAIRQTAKTQKWKKALADQVKRQVREKLVRNLGTPTNSDKFRTVEEEDDATIDAAADHLAGIIQLHRKDLDKLRDIEADLFQRLKDDEQQIVIGWYQGQATEHVITLGLDERSKVLQRLVAVMGRRIELERQAWGIDDDNGCKSPVDGIEIYQEF